MGLFFKVRQQWADTDGFNNSFSEFVFWFCLSFCTIWSEPPHTGHQWREFFGKGLPFLLLRGLCKNSHFDQLSPPQNERVYKTLTYYGLHKRVETDRVQQGRSVYLWRRPVCQESRRRSVATRWENAEINRTRKGAGWLVLKTTTTRTSLPLYYLSVQNHSYQCLKLESDQWLLSILVSISNQFFVSILFICQKFCTLQNNSYSLYLVLYL